MAKITKITERVYSGVRFALILDKRHSQKENGYPIAVRITHNYRQKYFLHGDFATEDEFAKIAKVGKGTLYEKRKNYEMFYNRICELAIESIDDRNFNLSRFRIDGRNYNSLTLNEIYKERISQLFAEGKVNTSELYQTVLSKIEDKFGIVDIDSVDINFAKKFSKEIEDLSKTTQSIYLRNLRAVCNYSIYKGYMKQTNYPFSGNRYDSNKIKIPKGSARRDNYLSVENMRLLYEYKGIYERDVNLFLFSYLANGANLVDIAKLKFNNHYYKSKKKELQFIRQKTKDTSSSEIVIYIPITKWLQEVMNRLGVEEKRNGFLLPEILRGCETPQQEARRLDDYSKQLSKNLKKACAEVGIEENISMTWARHSFKTNLIRQKVPDYYCEQAMGHSNNSVGAHYVGMFTIEDRMKYNEMLL